MEKENDKKDSLPAKISAAEKAKKIATNAAIISGGMALGLGLAAGISLISDDLGRDAESTPDKAVTAPLPPGANHEHLSDEEAIEAFKAKQAEIKAKDDRYTDKIIEGRDKKPDLGIIR